LTQIYHAIYKILKELFFKEQLNVKQ